MRTLEGECKEGVLHIEASTREFPTTAEMEVRTSTMQMKITTGVVALAWNSSPEIPQQQENSCSVVDEELLFPASISTARNWRESTCALLYRTCELSTLKRSRRRLTTRNLKLSPLQQEPTLWRWVSASQPASPSPDSDAVDPSSLLYTISIGLLYVSMLIFNLLLLGVTSRLGGSVMPHNCSVVAWWGFVFNY